MTASGHAGARRRLRASRFGAAFAIPAVRAIWIAELQSTIGDLLARVALMLLVYQRTGSPIWTALTLGLSYLPDLVGSVTLSWLADRLDRRLLAVLSATVQAVLFAVMALPGAPLWLIMVLIALSAVALAPYRAALQAALPELAGRGDALGDAQSLLAFTRQVAQVAGLALSVAAVTVIGPQWALTVNAATFAVSAILLWVALPPLPAPAPTGTDATTWRRSMTGGLGELRRNPQLRGLTGLLCLAGVVAVPDGIAAPLVDQLGSEPASMGWLLAAHPVGMALGTYLMPRAADTAGRLIGPLVLLTLLPLVIAGVVLSTIPTLWCALLLLTFSGVGMAFLPTVQTQFLRHSPDHLRGSLVGLGRTVMRCSLGVGVVLGGLVAQWSGSTVLTIAGASVCGLLIARWSLRRWHTDYTVPSTTN
ncbi:MFS transporter [Umezawaea sp. Da 62-37]|uniref:MFS transporter n=1 Tax=Umezawaea sp. Da 62-37 TaxID=3075927 RepID=UPI0028F6C6AB|nr:MFS transporter [Umezawaea sp. Da 62-37]WNV83182.1 MFS transporter [Umezawaea sp. Da 62-37]